MDRVHRNIKHCDYWEMVGGGGRGGDGEARNIEIAIGRSLY